MAESIINLPCPTDMFHPAGQVTATLRLEADGPETRKWILARHQPRWYAEWEAPVHPHFERKSAASFLILVFRMAYCLR